MISVHIHGFAVTLICIFNLIQEVSTSSCPQNSKVYHGNGYSMCYWKTSKTFPESGHAKCQEDGGMIGEILDAGANAFVKSNLYEQRQWIGYNDRNTEGHLENWNGQPLKWHNFTGGRPSDQWGLEDCVILYDWGAWNDLRCNYAAFPVLCSKLKSGYYPWTVKQSVYFRKITTDGNMQLGPVINTIKSHSDVNCFSKGCALGSYCYAVTYDNVAGECVTYTFPSTYVTKNVIVTTGSQIWIAHDNTLQ